MHPIIIRIQTNTEGVHLLHIKLACLNAVGCAVCVLNVSCCCRFELIPENEAPICHLLVCVVVGATVETVKVWLAFRLAQ